MFYPVSATSLLYDLELFVSCLWVSVCSSERQDMDQLTGKDFLALFLFDPVISVHTILHSDSTDSLPILGAC